jgi:hypothetical protein
MNCRLDHSLLDLCECGKGKRKLLLPDLVTAVPNGTTVNVQADKADITVEFAQVLERSASDEYVRMGHAPAATTTSYAQKSSSARTGAELAKAPTTRCGYC